MPLTATTKQAIMERVRNRAAIISGLAQQNLAEPLLGPVASSAPLVTRLRQRNGTQIHTCELLIAELEEILSNERD